MTDTGNHPTLDELDAVRTGEGTAADEQHAASCGTCQAALADVEAIVAVLRDSQAQISIPDSVDRRMLWLAQKQAASIRRRRPRITGARWAIAASVLLALGAAGVWRWRAIEPLQVAAPATLGRDVDGNGRVDILDAFTLARALKANSATDASWDFDRDGHVDSRDVDLIARAAVALGNS